MAVFIKGNRWYIDYYANSRRKREVVGHVDKITRTQAEKALKARVGEIVQGKFNIEQTKKPVLFEKLIEKYLEWAKTNHRCYWRDEQVAKVLLKFFGGKLLSQIKSWDIERYKRERKAQGRKPETINRELTVLKRMFNLAMQWDITTVNPVKGVKFMEVPKAFYRALEDEEYLFQSFKERSLTSFYREFWQATKKAGVKCTFHTLRHTFASNLVTRLKEDMVTVMELTGHKDIRMLKRYSHTKEEFKKAAITKLGKHLKSLNMDTSSDTCLSSDPTVISSIIS